MTNNSSYSEDVASVREIISSALSKYIGTPITPALVKVMANTIDQELSGSIRFEVEHSDHPINPNKVQLNISTYYVRGNSGPSDPQSSQG